MIGVRKKPRVMRLATMSRRSRRSTAAEEMTIATPAKKTVWKHMRIGTRRIVHEHAACEKEERIRLHDRARKEGRKGEGVDAEEEQRVREGPEKTEDRAAVAGFQVARGERGDQLTIAVEVSEFFHVECAGHAGALRAAAWPPHSTVYASSVTINISVVAPTWNSDLSCSSTMSAMRWPSTSVPFVEPRSRRRIATSRTSIAACRREASVSFNVRSAFERPIVTRGFSIRYTAPASGPAITATEMRFPCGICSSAGILSVGFSGSGDCSVVSSVFFGSSRRVNVRPTASGATGCGAFTNAGFWISKISAHLAHLIFFAGLRSNRSSSYW